jgi:hypothetical protein
MDKILEDAGLSTVRERFKEERIDPEIVIAMSDVELARLGVQTIGDRIRLRSACRGKTVATNVALETNTPSSSATSTSSSSTAATVASERARLFNPRHSRVVNRKRKASRSSGRTWTAQVFCLADRQQTSIPNASTKQLLHNAGLGLKKIRFLLDDDEAQVAQKIMSDEVVEGETVGFPQLKDGCGFELLQCQSNCRQLTMITCRWAVKDLKANLGTQSKIYVRSIQKNLSTKPLKPEKVIQVKQTCNGCLQEFPMHELRNHLYTCTAGLFDSNSEAEANDGLGIETDDDTLQQHQSNEVIVNNVSAVIITQGHDEQEIAISTPLVTQDDVNTPTHDPIVIEIESTDNNSEIETEMVQNMGQNEKTYVDHVNSIINEISSYCQEHKVTSTKEVVRLMQSKLVRGRSLEIESEDSCPEGTTNYILVDRYNILETGMEEIAGLHDPFLTLDVQFYGEVI